MGTIEEVILVNEDDVAQGTMEKLEAHKKGVLHRAFSILIFNTKSEILLQKRAKKKYHSGGLWTNTCCSHPVMNRSIEDCAEDRLILEMGLKTPLRFLYKFIYRIDWDGLSEYELDYVFIGQTDQQPTINPDEAEAWCYKSPEKILHELATKPETYSHWFKLIMEHPKTNEFFAEGFQ